MRIFQRRLLHLLSASALILAPSCDKQRILREEVEEVKAQLAKTREQQRSAEDQIRAIDAAHPGSTRDKLSTTESELRSVQADVQVLRNRVENAEKNHQRLVDELAFYQKELSKL